MLLITNRHVLITFISILTTFMQTVVCQVEIRDRPWLANEPVLERMGNTYKDLVATERQMQAMGHPNAMYNYMDEIANMACVGMSTNTGAYTAVRRRCANGDSRHCTDICTTNILNTHPALSTRSFSTCSAIESLHVAPGRTKLSQQPGQNGGSVGQIVYRYGSTTTGGCGPNFCCCWCR